MLHQYLKKGEWNVQGLVVYTDKLSTLVKYVTTQYEDCCLDSLSKNIRTLDMRQLEKSL